MKQKLTFITGVFLILFLAAFTVPLTAKAENVIGLPGEYHVDAEKGTRSEMSIGLTEPGASAGATDATPNIKMDKPGDVRISFDVYVPTAVFDKMQKTDQCFQIQPVEDLRIPGKQWYSFFGYTIGVKKTVNGYDSFSFANHYTDKDVNSIKTDNPDYVKISDLGDYVKISVVNEPIDTSGANCFDIEEDKEYEGASAVDHFQAGTYKVFCPVIRISQGGDNLYTDDVTFLITNQSASVAGKKVYIADYSRKNPVGYYTAGFGDEGNAEELDSVTWNIPDAGNDDTKKISSVSVNVTAPKAGSSSSVIPAVSVPAGQPYTVEAAGWYGPDGTTYDPPAFTFEAGKTYTFWVTLKADDAYDYEDSVAATVTGGTLKEVTGVYNDPVKTYSGVAIDINVVAVQEKAPTPSVNPATPSTDKKSDQPMTVKASKKTVKAKKLKKKKQVVSPITVKSAQGKLTFKITAGNKKSKKVLTINKSNGKVTVKKGTKKGTYKVKVTVSAAGNKQYKAGSKTVDVKIVVK